MSKIVSLLIMTSVCAAAQAVEGSVFDAATGAGIRGVKVELLRSTTPFYETLTDFGGRFRFDNIPEADYSIRYQSQNYWLTAGPTDYKPFHVGAGDPVKLEMRLMPFSKLAGRVVDRAGKGIPNAQLELTGSGMLINGRTYMRTSWGGGGGGALSASGMSLGFMNTTDASGRFEVLLMPGSYRLSAAPAADAKPPEPDSDGVALAWKRTYYPGVALAEAGQDIVVLPSTDVTNIELRLLAAPTHALRGVVRNPDGTPAAGVSVTAAKTIFPIATKSEEDGTFELAAIPEGECEIAAEITRSTVKLRAHQWLEVPRHDVEGLALRLAVPLTIRGKLRVEEGKEGVTMQPPALFLGLSGGRFSSSDRDLQIGAILVPGQNGDLSLMEAYPGVHQFRQQLQPPRAPYYLESFLIGEADLIRQDAEIAFDTTFTLVYRGDGGSVTGAAENCASGGVVLVPADPERRRAGFSHSGACDPKGRYEIRGIRPGDYYALAFAGNGQVVTVDDRLIKQAAKVTVRANETASLDLRAVTKPIFEK